MNFFQENYGNSRASLRKGSLPRASQIRHAKSTDDALTLSVLFVLLTIAFRGRRLSSFCLRHQFTAAGQVDGPACKCAVLACIVIDTVAVALDVGKGCILVADGSHVGVGCEFPAARAVERDGGACCLLVFVERAAPAAAVRERELDLADLVGENFARERLLLGVQREVAAIGAGLAPAAARDIDEHVTGLLERRALEAGRGPRVRDEEHRSVRLVVQGGVLGREMRLADAGIA